MNPWKKCANIPRLSNLSALMEKILIVEDDQAVQKALKRLFESAGYVVEISGDERSALEAFRSTAPTAILLDLRLPVLSGKDVCLQLRQLSALPIVILSASTDVVDKVVLLELGADDYVTKPFSPRELLARVRAAIRSTRKPIIPDEAKFNGICVDFTRMEVIREGEPIALTAEEFKQIQSHVVHTYQFLIQIPWTKELRGVPEIARSHHEKLNGSGYPNRLGAAEIPVQSKMMTISDIFDALTASDRPYKAAVPVARALDILGFERKAGAVDADLLELFIAVRPWEKRPV